MNRRVTFGQLRAVLRDLGFHETRRKEGIDFEHQKSDTLFLFRPYKVNDRITPAEFFIVRKFLDEKGLLEAESFEMLLTKAPA